MKSHEYIPHDHERYEPGCHRCEIGLDEATDSVTERAEEWLRTHRSDSLIHELVRDLLSIVRRR